MKIYLKLTDANRFYPWDTYSLIDENGNNIENVLGVVVKKSQASMRLNKGWDEVRFLINHQDIIDDENGQIP
jgi:hypothetical protein